HVQLRGGAHAEAIAAADRAREVALALGLQEPARALGFHGEARAYVGDVGGIAELERAVRMLVEEGAGWESGGGLNNLAIARYPLQGPAPSLAAFEEAVQFCEQRGLVELATGIESNCPLLLVELGRTEQAFERATKSAAALEASGSTQFLLEVCCAGLVIQLARGESVDFGEVDSLVESARPIGSADVKLLTLATAASAYLRSVPPLARTLLDEADRTSGTHETPYYARQLPAMVRTALAADDLALAERL